MASTCIRSITAKYSVGKQFAQSGPKSTAGHNVDSCAVNTTKNRGKPDALNAYAAIGNDLGSCGPRSPSLKRLGSRMTNWEELG